MKRFLVLFPIILPSCEGFAPVCRRRKEVIVSAVQAAAVGEKPKSKFLEALDPDRPYDLNARSETRTQLLNEVILKGSLPGGGGLSNPGSVRSFSSVAPGTWRVVYAPHMTIMAGLFRGEFSVQYDLEENGTLTSHAKYKFPLFNLHGYLSTSGTYGSVNDDVCRVDFDEAWIRSFDDDSFEQGPYSDIGSVPNSIMKSLVRIIGRALFIEPFAVFPVSYLDDELIVFDFELLGTRICARKES
mmetsp:Transcript_4672/g.10059  ORF Transcript_4672/g.10059 Transcript_4672/m.10059 type:complete len:243 (+) Transcript_4672:58-786(+)